LVASKNAANVRKYRVLSSIYDWIDHHGGLPVIEGTLIRLQVEQQAADRWTWLIIAAHTQLFLARPLAADLRRPWERPAPPDRLTPARVRRGFRNIRPTTALPASAPKPTKPGPGRPPGSQNRRPAPRHDVGKTAKRDLTVTARKQRTG
jgi:hypothetical protein